MKLSERQFYTLFLVIISFILFYSVFKMIDYLSAEQYIVECFTPGPIKEGPNTSHSVDLPLNTTYNCKNFCSPTSRCAITGQQCFTDIDCPGCQPYSPPLPKSNENIPGDNDAGKLTYNINPRYSSLTSGFGTQERVITNNMFSKPSMPNFGGNIWFSDFIKDKKMFDERYKPKNIEFMPNYPERYSLTGQFIEDGPFAANSPDLY